MGTSTAGTGLPGRVLGGRYELGTAIGRGGSATVYRARDRRSGRPVAVKVFTGAVDGVPARRRVRETDLLAGLDHPGLVAVLDAGVADPDGVHECAFLVMELVEGLTLAACRDGGPMPEARVTRIGRDLAAGLAHVHSRGITHRDVTPTNVLIDGTGRARLTDFGIALLVDQTRITASGAVIGTAAYMSPEQVCGDPVGPPTDVYALGLVLLEAVTGRRAYSGTGREVAIARLTRRPEIPSGLTGPLARLLPEMTAYRPEDRPSADEVAATLDDGGPRTAAMTVPPPAPGAATPRDHTAVEPPVPPTGRTSRTRRRPALVVAALAVVGCLGGAGAWALSGGTEADGGSLAPVVAPPVGSVLPAPSFDPEPVRATVPTPLPATRSAAPTAAGRTSAEAPRPAAGPPERGATGERDVGAAPQAQKGAPGKDEKKNGKNKDGGRGEAGKGPGRGRG